MVNMFKLCNLTLLKAVFKKINCVKQVMYHQNRDKKSFLFI